MDLSSPFRSEVFRPIVAILIPGLLAGFPYALVIGHHFPELAAYGDDHELVYFTIVTLIVIGLGLVLEDIGTRIELRMDAHLIKTAHPDLYEVWHDYLKLQFDKEPIGQGYLRTVLLRLKFELSAAVSILLCFFGLIWLSNLKNLFSMPALVFLGMGFISLSMYLLYEAYEGAKVLANVRRILVGKPALDT